MDRAARPGLGILWLLVVVAVGVRIWLVATTVGTNDVIYKTLWANLIEKYGVLGAYAKHDVLNESGIKVALFPPLSLATFKLMLFGSKISGIEYTDVFRLFQVIADLVAAGSLFVIGTRFGGRRPRHLTLFYLLCPAVIFVSAFHCNTDSTMVALIILAAAAFPYGSRGSIGAGISLAAATGIKILPLFALPFFFLASLRQKTARGFTLAYALTLFLIFLPPEILGDEPVLHRILSYAGYPSNWGFTGLFLVARGFVNETTAMGAARFYFNNGKFFVIAAILALLVWQAIAVLRGRTATSGHEIILMSMPFVYLAALFFAPGFGPQYLLWPIPFLPFLFGWRWSIALAGLFSIYLFVVYTAWSGGFPWWYADATNLPPTGSPIIQITGYVTWIAIGASLVRGVRVMAQRMRVES